jgi:hypothetical protein
VLLPDRRAFLEGSQEDIEERLTRKLGRRIRPRHPVRSRVAHPAQGAGAARDGLRLVRRAGVAEAARVLREIAPAALFDQGKEDWLYDDFPSWRDLYLAAAEHGEAVIVGD